MQICKDYQNKNTSVIMSDCISQMVEQVLGGQLEVSGASNQVSLNN